VQTAVEIATALMQRFEAGAQEPIDSLGVALPYSHPTKQKEMRMGSRPGTFVADSDGGARRVATEKKAVPADGFVP